MDFSFSSAYTFSHCVYFFIKTNGCEGSFRGLRKRRVPKKMTKIRIKTKSIKKGTFYRIREILLIAKDTQYNK